MTDEKEEITMTNEEIIKKIKEICNKYVVENGCPFYNKNGGCIFWQQGMPIPLKWCVDNE